MFVTDNFSLPVRKDGTLQVVQVGEVGVIGFVPIVVWNGTDGEVGGVGVAAQAVDSAGNIIDEGDALVGPSTLEPGEWGFGVVDLDLGEHDPTAVTVRAVPIQYVIDPEGFDVEIVSAERDDSMYSARIRGAVRNNSNLDRPGGYALLTICQDGSRLTLALGWSDENVPAGSIVDFAVDISLSGPCSAWALNAVPYG